MSHAVVGFAFSADFENVVLIRKNKPAWQAGFLNGVGGKVEDFDAGSQEAMSREFFEETGVRVPPGEWFSVGGMFGADWSVDVLATATNNVLNARTMESEEVSIREVQGVAECECIPNVPMLISLAKFAVKHRNVMASLVLRYAGRQIK